MFSADQFTTAFHGGGKTKYTPDYTPLDPALWPHEWKITYYKDYSRFKTIPLPVTVEVPPSEADFFKLIRTRRSCRDFSTDSITLEQLGTILQYSCGEFLHDDNVTKRAQPSGGARYPIEVYVVVWKPMLGLQEGIYHYNVRSHGLDVLIKNDPQFDKMFRDTWTKDAGFALVYTGVFQRTQMKYGLRGYRFMCIEVGSIVQNVYLLCGALGLKCVGYGGTNDDIVENTLHLDSEVESLITTILIGT